MPAGMPLPTHKEEKKICEHGGDKGFLLPLNDEENDMNEVLRASIYGFLLCYFFLGVSIIADRFMQAIEVITTRRRQCLLSNGRVITVRVWNDTVSNLTLMALGSSAPEILLALTELVVKKKMHAGELGPATIVGSASFNLLMIVGLCIFVIPSSESRKVREVPVFIVTVIFMFAAYFWLACVISWTSPDEVEIWEAVVTVLLLPVLVYLSYLADIGRLGECGKSIEVRDDEVERVCELMGCYDRETRDAIRLGLSNHSHYVKKLANPSSSDMDDLRKMVRKSMVVKKSRAARRIEATRNLTGGKRIIWDIAPSFGAFMKRTSGLADVSVQDVPIALPQGVGAPTVHFASESQSCCSSLKMKPVVIARSGDCSDSIIVDFKVEADLAYQDVDGPHALPPMRVSNRRKGSLFSGFGAEGSKLVTVFYQGSVTFEAHERHKTVDIQCPEACTREFVVVLTSVRVASGEGTSPISIGRLDRTMVILNRNQVPSRLAFADDRVLIAGAEHKQVLEVIVQRLDSCTGEVSCNFRTEALSSAVPGYDFTEASGTLEFAEGITEKFIELEILPKGKTQMKDEFLLVLEEAEGNAEFNPNNDGGVESEILTIEIAPRSKVKGTVRNFVTFLDAAINFDEMRLGTAHWSEQFVGAIYCNGSPEDQSEASSLDWFFHVLAFPWKLVFMFVPPTTYCCGWVCFWISLLFIGGLTAVIGDLAEIFGCCLGLSNLITAITFVALGTSMPDLFASWTAAAQDETADASIVNVTGSNSVNVFLGLGLPWTCGSIYWRVKEWDDYWEEKYPDVAFRARKDGMIMRFVVKSDDLIFSVAVYTVVAVVALVILVLRRRHIGAELGGPFALKVTSTISFFSLWGTYIALSAWWSQFRKEQKTAEAVCFFTIVCGVTAVPCIISIFLALTTIRPKNRSSTPEATETEPDLDSSDTKPAPAVVEATPVFAQIEVQQEDKTLTEEEAPGRVADQETCNDSREDPVVACESANTAPPGREHGETPFDARLEAATPRDVLFSGGAARPVAKADRPMSPPPPAEEGRNAAAVRATCCSACCVAASGEPVAVDPAPS